MLELTPDRVAWGLLGYVVMLFSLSVHESAHAWTALQMGDDTAARQGRITLNPLSHIDPIGTVLIPMLQLLFGGVPLLGWAKPTPVAAHNLRQLARGHVLVAAAGPASNLVLAAGCTLALFVAQRSFARENELVMAVIDTGLRLNIVLALFNLIPLPPLDGSWVVSWGLPRPWADPYDRVMEPYGQWILLLLFATGVLGWLLAPFTGALYVFLRGLAL